MDIESNRDNFAMKWALLQQELERILDKTNSVEAIIKKIIHDEYDSFVPDEETIRMQPRNKRMKIED